MTGSLALAIVLGAAIGVTLGALGAGGSILAVPVLVHLAGLPVEAATATSLVAVGAAAAVAASRHRDRVRWPTVGWFVATGAVGAFGGAAVGDRLDDDVLLILFSVLVLIAAHRMLTACPSCTRVGETQALETASATTSVADSRPRVRQLVATALAGVGVGFLTGLFGVGGGFVIVPVLTLGLAFAMPAAIATSLAIVAGNAVVALLIRGPSSVDWPIAVAFTLPMLAGSLIGAGIAHRLPPQRTLRWFATMLVLVAIANAASVVLG